jgi:integrase
MKLTPKAIADYTWPDRDTIVFDDDIPGFGLRRRNGRFSWVFQYKIRNVGRRMKIGDFPALPPVKARKEAEDLHAKVHLHGDPALERRRNRDEVERTFGRLIVAYLAHKRTELRHRSFIEVDRHLSENCRALHSLPLAAIRREDVARILNKLNADALVVGNRTRASLSAFFVWAMGQGLAQSNPVIGTVVRKETSRDRVLTADELKLIWHALPDNDYGVIVKILMLTGQRAREIGELQWSEIDFDRAIISLPGERTKNGRPHVIPMSPTVLALLRACPSVRDRPWVFGLRGKGWNRWGQEKLALNARLPRLMKSWTVRDLRRTAATGMADIGIQPHVIEAALNHVSSRSHVAGIYNRASYAKEKAEALAQWDAHVLGTIGGQ